MLRNDGVIIQTPKDVLVKTQPIVTGLSLPRLEELSYQTLTVQFQYILAQEIGVIEDDDPEYLHQMRVGFRRFQAAITVFEPAIILQPKFDSRDCKRVLKRLGTLRDLDVQLQSFSQKIKKALNPGDQRRLRRLQRDLAQDRQKAYKRVHKTLCKSASYQNFKRQIKVWLKHPQYQAIAQLPVSYCAPDLLAPLLSRLLLHPAWLMPQASITPEKYSTLHDLRKLCKQVRYQGEFFQDLYPKAFKCWIKEIKSIQSDLGQIQDACVYQHLMSRYQYEPLTQELLNWDDVRQRYCDPASRLQLRELILSPKA